MDQGDREIILGVEDLLVQAFIAQFAVEGLAIPIFSRAGWLDGERPGAKHQYADVIFGKDTAIRGCYPSDSGVDRGVSADFVQMRRQQLKTFWGDS